MEKGNNNKVSRKERLYRSEFYWMEMYQNDLYAELVEYMKENNLNQTQLADQLGFSKGYISQVLNGNFNHSLKKLLQLSLKMGKVPDIEYKSISSLLEEYENGRGKIVPLYPNKTGTADYETRLGSVTSVN